MGDIREELASIPHIEEPPGDTHVQRMLMLIEETEFYGTDNSYHSYGRDRSWSE